MGVSKKTKEYRYRLAESQNWRCAYCGGVLEFHESTVDHIVPKRENGPNTWYNLVTCCKFCNEAKMHCNAFRFYGLRQRGVNEGWWPPAVFPTSEAVKHLRALWRTSAR